MSAAAAVGRNVGCALPRGVVRTLGVCAPSSGPRGAAPRGGCLPAASISRVRNGGKNTRGERFSPLDSPLWSGISFGVSLFFCGLACGPTSPVGRGPPPSWAGWEAWVGGRREKTGKNPAKNILPKESPQIRARRWGPKKTTTARLRLYPKRGSEPQRAVLYYPGPGRSPGTLCVRAFSRESPDPRPGQGRGPRGRVHPALQPNGTAVYSVHFRWSVWSSASAFSDRGWPR